MDLDTYLGTPAVWRDLVSEINGRIPVGTPGVRDPDALCEVFDPVEGDPDGSGTCQTDGHYMCSECRHIELVTLRRRRDQCEDCGAKLERGQGKYGPEDLCSKRCTASMMKAGLFDMRLRGERRDRLYSTPSWPALEMLVWAYRRHPPVLVIL